MKIKNIGGKTLFLSIFIISSIFIFNSSEVKRTNAALSDLESSKVTAEYTLLEPLPCIPSQATPCVSATKTTVDIKEYVNYVFRLAIALAAFLAVLMFTIGGFQYMTSEAMGGKDEAKSRMKNAVFGLLAALTSYIILYTIDPRLVQINANIPDIKVARDDIFAPLDASLQAIQDRLDQIRHETAAAIITRDALHESAADLRDQADIMQDELDNTKGSMTDQQIASTTEKIAKIRVDANRADDQATIVTWQQSIKDDYLWALNSGTIASTTLMENRILNNYASNVASYNLINPEDPDVKAAEARLGEQKSLQLNDLENFKEELGVTQKTYTTASSLQAAKTAAITAIDNQTKAAIARTDDPAIKKQYQENANIRKQNINSVTKTTVGTATNYSYALANPAVYLVNLFVKNNTPQQ